MKKTVLIIDDEMDMRIFLKTLFETGGYMPVVTRNGKEGLQKAKELCPDLITLDVMMPGEGGVYMYRELRADPELRNIPVIMLSGVKKEAFFHYLNMLNIRPNEAAAQPEAYVEKPPDPEEVLKTAKKLIGD